MLNILICRTPGSELSIIFTVLFSCVFFYSVDIIDPCGGLWSLLPCEQGGFVGAQERIKIGHRSCHYHSPFQDVNPSLIASELCVLTTNPRLLLCCHKIKSADRFKQKI